jgi:hypothetical protein
MVARERFNILCIFDWKQEAQKPKYAFASPRGSELLSKTERSEGSRLMIGDM